MPATLRQIIADAERWELEPDELRDLLQRREEAPFLLIDCREEDEHVAGRIGEDLLMPLSRFSQEVTEHMTGEPPPMVVYCQHGVRSLQAVQYLRAKGFGLAYSLRGGLEAWASERKAD